ncbi:transcription factor MYB75, putative [Entamoeba invadens IP1]|uniref:Transcription factor MYB75, putative n=1 Tax=Entamoeba invadens IP1 TaxID=370355 RepID=A0A0A1U079_ENTIV|nr:transcription factor MYB75, putative [Entamoeba invadens IP1]ELP87284.1 transcription factor MYB75, putative [Entamoeba invadens IP1]|eukprot:XP_004254055.1 transcription factor MYB75, putative [Entamoeba invadens IP1]
MSLITSHSQCNHESCSSSSNSSKKTRKPAKIWSEKEDYLLKKGVEEFGKNCWKAVSQVVPGRTRKQCRERYLNHLDENVQKTAAWSKEEDSLILKKQEELGNRWTEISKFLPGRAANTVKNRFFSYLSKLKEKRRSPSNVGTPSAFVPASPRDFVVL